MRSGIRNILVGLMVLCLAASTPLRLGAASRQAPRLVFAHYMVCCPRAGTAATLADFQRDIEDAAAVGIDGFALNIGDWTGNPLYKTFTDLMFRAAQNTGPRFKLFFSADQLGAQDAADMLLSYRNHPNYLHVGNRPVLSSFGGDSAWGRDVRRIIRERGRTDVFLAPFFFAMHESPSLLDITALTWRHRDLDGFFAFGAAAPYADLARTIRREAAAWSAGGQLFIAGIAPYYRGLGINYRVFESDGYVGFVEQWRAAIEAGADWVELVTWNDWGESTYVAPVDHASTALVDGHPWGGLPTHRGFLELCRYLIAWFKTGKPPPVTQDQVFLAYRLHPAKAEGSRLPLAKSGDRPLGADVLKDRVHALTLLSKPATAELRVGGEVTRQDMPAGLGMMSAPLQPGTVEITLSRGATGLGSLTGRLPIGDDGATGNFNLYADWAALPGTR